MSFLSFFFLVTFQETMVLTRLSQFELETPTHGFDSIITDPEGNFYAALYLDSRIYKFGQNGKFLQEIAPPGKGPGEVIKPMAIFLMENNRKLIVIEGSGKWHAFEAETGKFLEYPSTYLPARRWAKWDDNHILGFFTTSDHFFMKVKTTGKVVKKWAEEPSIEPGILRTRLFAVAVTPDKRVLYQEGMFPEVLVYTEGSNNHVGRKLKPPAYYREPPKPYNFKKEGYNRIKMRGYLSSFTQLARLAILDEKYLVVLWIIHEPYDSCLAVYDLAFWKPVVQDFISPGRVFHTSKDLIYVVEEIDTETDVKVLIHKYRLSSKESL